MFGQVSCSKPGALKEALMSTPSQKQGLIQPSRRLPPVPWHLTWVGFGLAGSTYRRRALQAPQCQVPFYTHPPAYEHPMGLRGCFSESDVSEQS